MIPADIIASIAGLVNEKDIEKVFHWFLHFQI